jgi:hypothetical protein
MISLMVAAWVAQGGAFAAEDASPKEAPPVLVGFRGIGEVWQDPFIVESYRSSRFSGAGFAAFGLNPWVQVELELGYMRTDADSGRRVTYKDQLGTVASGAMELVPVSADIILTRDLGRAEAFAGGGFAMAVFTERTDAGTVGGAKPGIDMKTGIRVHTQFVEPRFRPHSSTGVEGVDVELLLGRRKHQPFDSGQGFDFSAWRVGAGVVARF